MNRIEELEAEVARLRERVAALEEALDMLAIATRKYRSLPRIDGDTIGRLEAELREALEKARALQGDVSRWELPEFAPTGNAGDPVARMKCCASCRWMSLSWADRILLGRGAAICTHPKTGRQDPVSGQIIGRAARCSHVRQGRLSWIDGDSCGPEGRWWEATE